jgi:hypothetical protein
MRHLVLPFLLLLLAGCATAPVPDGKPPTADAVKSLALRLRADNLDTLEPKQIVGIESKIADNLKSWGYPLQAAGSAAKPASHRLETWVGKAERKSLPPGFSLSFGSQDLRAPERQQTDVVKVGCTLLPNEGKEGKISLSGEFSAYGAGQSVFDGMAGSKSQEDFYVDRIGSVCLNLLEELKVAKESGQASLAPAWMPAMRIEIKTKPGVTKPGISAPPPAPAAADSKPAAKPADAAASQPVSPPEKPAIRTEEKSASGDGRKQMIIHNQGSPIILEFGYDENRGMKW